MSRVPHQVLKKGGGLAEDDGCGRFRPRSPGSMSNSPSQAPEPDPPASFQQIETEGFPWTGLTLVLVVLGLIAFMAVPSGPVSPRARAAERLEVAASIALGEFRAAIREYRLDHHDFPGQNPRASVHAEDGSRWLVRQLTLNTDDEGHPAAAVTPEHPHGPYLPAGLPRNPVNELDTVKLAASSEAFTPDDSTGWVYFKAEGDVRLNSSATLRASSTRYYDL